MVNEIDVFNTLIHIKDISQDDYEKAVDLCRQCFDSVKSELKSGVDISDPRIINAAAAQAFYFLCLKEKNDIQQGETSFKAGDISITQKESETNAKLEEAKSLYENAVKKLSPLKEDNGFFFGKVDI